MRPPEPARNDRRPQADASLCVPPGAPPDRLLSSVPLTKQEIELFDQIVVPELVFPDIGERSRYVLRSPETVDGKQRLFGYQLRQQPGMETGRHFHIISIAFSRAGTLIESSNVEPKVVGTGGPNGAFSDVYARTSDGCYDLRVGDGMLLVEGVDVPGFNMQRVSEALLGRYAALQRQH